MEGQFDVIVIGAGFSGVHAVYKLKSLGFSVLCLEKSDKVGGTWAANSYPGCKCDVDSKMYSYTWCDEVTVNWRWKHRYGHAPEIQSYIQKVVDVYKLGDNIALNTAVTQMAFDENEAIPTWKIKTHNNKHMSARYVLMATGALSQVNKVKLPGSDMFKGRIMMSQKWPKGLTDFTGRRVAVIGTGSTGAQMIPQVAKSCESLHIFMRTPPYVLPANDYKLSEDEAAFSKVFEEHKKVIHTQTNTGSGTLAQNKSFAEMSAENGGEAKIIQDFEEMWQRGGVDVLTITSDTFLKDAEGNKFIQKQFYRKICESINDPALHTSLLPKYAPMCKRPVIADGFYESINKDNVTLVPLNGTSVEAFSENGLVYLDGQETPFDDVIFCTGFDALTGSFTAINVVGRDGRTLRDTWKVCPKAYLGLMVHGFPNMFTVTGPQSPSVLSNMVSSIELHIDWISDLLEKMRQDGCNFVECDERDQDEWVESNNAIASVTVFEAKSCNAANSWYRGANIDGKSTDVVLPYVGGCLGYRMKLKQVVQDDYAGFHIKKQSKNEE